MSENTVDKALRLDLAVAEKLNISRTIAADIIVAGHVKTDGKTMLKPGTKIDTRAVIEIEGEPQIFASRGGAKLAAAIKTFGIDLVGLTCMDVGAGAGGFTDCMLKHGAKSVYAIDIGTSQLKDELRADDRVISWENTDIRLVERSSLPKIDFVSVDVSFISLEKILPAVYNLIGDKSAGILLVKPQFEAGKGAVNKKGIIKNPKIRYKTLEKVYNYAKEAGFVCTLHIESAVNGGGNVEYLVHVLKGGDIN
ncbi:MAG: TlyA family RNA methyltransferase [Defluviitaleaceae bacterium]|nr:TlyA family RNA methyltransferase [Defluviitaleaceae bacterium]